MFKSLRWRLQVWHALVLLTVLTSFGGLVHRLHWETRLQQIDAELDRTGGMVMSQLRRLGLRLPGRPGGGPRRVRRPDEQNTEAEGGPRADATLPENQQRPEPRREGPRPESPPPPENNIPRRDRPFLDPGPLPEEFTQLFQGDEDSRLYFVIWGGNGDLLQKSEFAPEIKYPNLHIGTDGLPAASVLITVTV